MSAIHIHPGNLVRHESVPLDRSTSFSAWINHNGELKIYLPGTRALRFRLKHDTQPIDTTNIQAWISGRVSESDATDLPSLQSQLEYLYGAFVDTAVPLAEGTVFSSPEDFGMSLANALFTNRKHFAAIVDVTDVHVALSYRRPEPPNDKARSISHANIGTTGLQQIAAPSEVSSETVVSSHIEPEPVDVQGTEETKQPKAVRMISSPDKGGVYIAFGSNMGNRIQNIEAACRLLDADPDIRLLRVSSLYDTEPMYVENQDRFLNGVCEVRLVNKSCLSEHHS
jgi:hypothetical protein